MMCLAGGRILCCAKVAASSWSSKPYTFQLKLCCRVSNFVKLRFVSRTGNESLYIAEIQHFLRAVNANGETLRLAVCKLLPARYGLPKMKPTRDVMVATLSTAGEDRVYEVSAVDISQLDTKLVTAKDGGKLFGIVYRNTSGMT